MRMKNLKSLPAVHAAPPPIAIDFGASSLKVLQISGGQPPKLVAAAQVDVPDEVMGDPAARLRFQIEALPKLIKKGKFTTRRAVFMIPPGQMFCKHMQLQVADGVDVDALLRAALPAQVGCDYESLVCRHVVVNNIARAGKAEVICMAASRDLVGRLMQALKVAHLEPVGVHGPFQAAIRAFWSINRRAEDATRMTLFLDLGYATTNVMVAEGENLVFARTVEMSGLQMDQAIAKAARIPIAEARDRRRRITVDVSASAPARATSSAGSGLAMLNAALAASGKGSEDGAQPEAADSAVAVGEERREGAKPAPGLTPEIAPGAIKLNTPPGVDLKEQLEILTDEILMSVRYHKSLFPNRAIERVVLFGGDARQAWLGQYLAKALRMPVQVSDPIGGLSRNGSEPVTGVNFGEPQPGWTAALGMCLSPTDL